MRQAHTTGTTDGVYARRAAAAYTAAARGDPGSPEGRCAGEAVATAAGAPEATIDRRVITSSELERHRKPLNTARSRAARPAGRPGGVHDPRVAASYCAVTPAGMRPRSLTAMPCCFAQARMPPPGCRVAGAQAGAVTRSRPCGHGRGRGRSAGGERWRSSRSGQSLTLRRRTGTAPSRRPGRPPGHLRARP